MSFSKISMALAATAMLGTVGASPAYAGSPQCGVFDDNSGTITITTQGAQFSFSQLMNEGRLSGRGPQFGCWAEIGRSDEIRGTLMYAYRVTDPNGQSIEFGPYGIQAGGFGSGSIAISANQVGTWRVEYLTVRRDNYAKASIGSTTFTLTP
jgi:hypothetical protein